MIESRFFKKVLTPAEVGNTGTHEKYIRLTNDFDYVSFFQDEGVQNGSVRQIDFVAIDLTEGISGNASIPFRFVYYENSNGEKRIPSLGNLYNSHNVKEGDVIILESRTENDKTSFFFTHCKAVDIVLKPATIYYTEKRQNNVPTQKGSDLTCSRQIIYYGAPGTGKSFAINEITKTYSAIRTTFHPDSDYSTFVGAYKPTMEDTPVYGAQGFEVAKEKRITYTFVKQAFLKAYLAAWKKYAEGGDSAEPQFLIIEEINRGNCAQIFGDLFQLLDRSDNGFSTYPIEADSDLQKEIENAFGNGGEYALDEFDVDDVVEDYISNYDGSTLTDGIKLGRVLLLPNNLYIWATMNTSDQSLFPIDSAFKRRWDWKYTKIADAGKGWKVQCGNEYCDWWTFVTEINKLIAKETSSDDKKLGYFFCKPAKDSEYITEDKFVGKVLFYLWNDVFKDGDVSLFNVSDNGSDDISFDAFYNDDNKVNVATVRKFLMNVVKESNILKKGEEPMINLTDEDADGIDYTKYSFDGTPRLSKKDLGYNIVMKYINEHSDKPFAELQNDLAFDDAVANKYRYKGVLARTEEITGSYTPCFGAEQTSSDGVKYKVLTWWNKYNIDFIIQFAKNQGWTVEVTE